MTLKDYKQNRDFEETPEPRLERSAPEAQPRGGEAEERFMVHMHDASRLHWDLRVELGAAYKSWAVPKGPSLDPAEKRLAVLVEDHPMKYGDFRSEKHTAHRRR